MSKVFKVWIRKDLTFIAGYELDNMDSIEGVMVMYPRENGQLLFVPIGAPFIKRLDTFTKGELNIMRELTDVDNYNMLKELYDIEVTTLSDFKVNKDTVIN